MSDLEGKIVCITGGTGSFGSTMVTHLLGLGLKEIRVFSRDEAKQDAMRHKFSDDQLRFYLGDVRNRDSLRPAFEGCDYLFHAAALKQVPSGEFFPMEVTRTNVLGSHNTLSVAAEHGVKKVVCLSTDKAVYPVNAMGMSKALMEKTALAFTRQGTSHMNVSITRYGNVLYSRGSVVPLFIKQMKEGRPLTVTNPEMTRFLMTLEESISLVLHAFSNRESGNTYVKKAKSASIQQLATVLGRLFKCDNGVSTIGTRHGEKLFESLLSEEELPLAVDQGEYFSVPLDVRELNYGPYFEEGSTTLSHGESFNSHNAQRFEDDELEAKLLSVPEIRKEYEAWKN